MTGRKPVRSETRERVLQAVRECQYLVPASKRLLTAHFAHVVALVVRDVTNPFFSELNEGARGALLDAGYHIVYHGSDLRLEEDVEVLRMFEASRVAGYMLSAMDEGPTADFLSGMVRDGTPVVVLGGSIPGVDTPCVLTDFRGGARLAAEHLIEQGHRRIAYLAGPPKWTDERVMGYMEAMLKHEIAFEDGLIYSAGITANEGYEAMKRVLGHSPERPTAVACFNDLVAIGAYRAAREAGLCIPRDLSIVGFDNIEVTDVLGPPLTTVDIHPRVIGAEAARLLLAVMGGATAVPECTVVGPELVVRASVAAPARK